mmetsp:Transcript_2997/g.10722  ORF Transcript_2997/g.10722 Transcript_2997/m.10722 type:complete len:202 (-) Transcript_2997:285-890(-)
MHSRFDSPSPANRVEKTPESFNDFTATVLQVGLLVDTSSSFWEKKSIIFCRLNSSTEFQSVSNAKGPEGPHSESAFSMRKPSIGVLSSEWASTILSIKSFSFPSGCPVMPSHTFVAILRFSSKISSSESLPPFVSSDFESSMFSVFSLLSPDEATSEEEEEEEEDISEASLATSSSTCSSSLSSSLLNCVFSISSSSSLAA